MTLVAREQGLLVPKGNAKGIQIAGNDLGRDDVRFVNRQRGAGTRILLDYELEKAGVSMLKSLRVMSKKSSPTLQSLPPSPLVAPTVG